MPDEVDELILKMQPLEAQAPARAEAHRQMADDPLFKGVAASTALPPSAASPSTSTPTSPSPSTPTSPSSSTSTSTPASPSSSEPAPAGPRKTLGRRRPKGT